MNDLTDSELLTKFIDENDELAFASLVQRHANVAYSAVVSLPGGAGLADEACQLAFIELAKKARFLRNRDSLTGWLFQATRNQARNLRRSEIRRRERERSYMNVSEDEKSASHVSEDLLNDVMAVLSKLGPRDRDLVVLRYLEGKSFPKIAEIFGYSVDGTRMRVNRALGKMNRILRRKGVTSSTALIASTISAQGIQQAPPALVNGILQATSLGAATLPTSAAVGGTVIIFMKQKVLITSIVVFSGVAGYTVYQHEGKKSKVATEDTVDLSYPENPLKIDESQRSSGIIPVTKSSKIIEPGEERGINNSNENKIIPLSYLERAEALLKFVELEEQASTGEKTLYSSDVPDKGKVLGEVTAIALRLRLNEEQKEQLKAVVEENFEVRKSYENSAGPSFGETLLQLTEERMIDYLALELIKESDALNEEQQSYFDELEVELREFEDEYYESTAPEGIVPAEWQKNSELLAQIDEFLAPDQQQELQEYLRENEQRRVEEVVFRRTEDLSFRLGLDNTEKSNLRTYLQQNPNASEQEISEILDPDLAEILLGK